MDRNKTDIKPLISHQSAEPRITPFQINDSEPLINEKEEDNTIVQRWLALQKIIKEEITLSEIISNQQDQNKAHLYNNYYEYYRTKLQTRETLENVINIDNNNFQLNYFELVKKPDTVLKDAIDPIENLFILMRGNFDFIIKTIAIIDEGETAREPAINTLVDLFCHQFYEDLLIPNPEKEDLLLLCYLLLEKEISYMNSASVSSFIDENSTFVGKFLKSYTKKQELKTYLSMTLGSLILSIENSSNNCLDLNPTRIQIYLNRQTNDAKSKEIPGPTQSPFPYEDYLTQSIPKTLIHIKEENLYEDENEDEEGDELLSSKENPKENKTRSINNDYSIDINQEELNKKIQSEKDKNLKEFYLRQLERINKDPEIFTNKKFYQSLEDFGDQKKEILIKYKDNFEKIKDHIDNIIQSLIDKISTIPYALRCICKVIHRLIKEKFQKINTYERNAFIGEFIFGKCILPILINSDINAVITTTILSTNTRQCLKIIAKVLTKINRGLFFEANIDTDYTIFNHYIIEVIPLINTFYEKLIEVQLPKVLEEMIDKHIAQGFGQASMFKKLNRKNKDLMKKNSLNDNRNATEVKEVHKPKKEGIKEKHCCVCYSVDDILQLLKIIKPRVKEYLTFNNGSFFEKTIEKINNYEFTLSQLNKTPNKRQFFLYFKEPRNTDLISIDPKKTYSMLDDNKDNTLVLERIKFCIKIVLTGLNLINSKDYSYLNAAKSNKGFLNALRNTLQEIEEFSENESNTIPLKWYSGYIYNNKMMLPPSYIDSDYASLIKELLEEEQKILMILKENSSILIASNGMNIRFAEKLIEKAKGDMMRIKKIEYFMKMEKFINQTTLEVCFTTDNDKDTSNSNESKGYWNFGGGRKSNIIKDEDLEKPKIIILSTDKCMHKRLNVIKGDSKDKDSTVNNRHTKTIKEFITRFSQYPEVKEDIKRENPVNKIYKTLETYLELVRGKLKQDEIFKDDNEKEYKTILERIGDHIMKNMYNDIFSSIPLSEDDEFAKKTEELKEITPAHLEIKAIYVNELKYATNCVKKINEGKSAYEKLNCIAMAHNTINNTIKFSSGKYDEAGADELDPIFQYIIIKARPTRFYSNIYYIKAFLPPSQLDGRYGYLLAQMESAAEYITKIDIVTLNKTKEEFEKKYKKDHKTPNIN